ncbi:hypothetical protein APHWI1_0380 [Anaplasma phagocytophilum str. ApWI1]|uniref:Uncharacterized protein n=1 Tax=Anaplasma phagocytophilum str. ApWI1 TaxID=1359155 RepID=A0A0F3PZ34_ANAPH|nr:hypothetical protein APHHGE2_1176 [Anaplasma phagocytophilum str. HGE2]KJV85635.1 hypothetical protein APHWI1_0380 [Anaplasma phagocytophilum str. ApWI1]KJV87091.1 hypothetical protein APHNYW_0889 [Anaplasma phagocytophilum str. ApNYW]KJV98353.1 hypothetical protein OTSANNIE_1148 [Anaplasma phagocytophilum str. Annie]KJZ98638.1 hypothetical protein APHCR_0374 [Anaplasma phagocytophilum str. CR1007]
MRVRSVAAGFSCYNLAAVLCRRRSSLVFFQKTMCWSVPVSLKVLVGFVWAVV